MTDQRVIDCLMVLANGLDEHIHLLTKINSMLKSGEDQYDFQTAAESNEALIELNRILNVTV